MNFNDTMGIENRVVKDAERDGQPTRIVSCERTYDTDPKDLWDAITNPERLPNWFLPITGDLKIGGQYQLEGNAGGEIIQCNPSELLEVSWVCGGTSSWVTVHLAPAGDGTRLTLEHIMSKDEKSESHWKLYGPGATGVGWDLGFVGLQLHLAHENATIDQKEFHEWMGSDPGKSFMRESAEAWSVAHVAAGVPTETAREMAEETIKAYTGG